MTETTTSTFRVYFNIALAGSPSMVIQSDSYQDKGDGMFTFYRTEDGINKFVASFRKDHVMAIHKI